MILSDFLSSLKTKNVQVTITDLQDNEIAKVYASSYDALDDDLVARKINRWSILGATSLAVILNDAEKPVETPAEENETTEP